MFSMLVPGEEALRNHSIHLSCLSGFIHFSNLSDFCFLSDLSDLSDFTVVAVG